MASLILLGAGASYGSGDVEPHPPPLGKDLFAALESVGGQAAGVPEFLKALFRDDFEVGMAAFNEYTGRNSMQFQRELAAYLAQFTPGPRNVYRRLIERIGPHRAVYASLNYDLLFEIAAARMQLNTIYGLEREPASVRLLKLHGSSNFWPDIPVGMLRNCSIFNSGRADVQAPIRPLDQAETLYRCRVEDSLSPAIAMYAEGKAVKVSPDYVDRQQSLWKVAVAEARRIFVVGVRVHNADVHVWGELEKAKAPVTYFGFSGDRAAFEDWRHLRGRRESYFIEADFSRSVDMIATSIGSRR